MTQVQKMSDRDLNLALAELMNYPKSRFVPNYCTDHAASLEAQTAAIKLNAVVYVTNLQLIKFHRSNGLSGREDIAVLMDSSPRERAEAAYITLSSKQ